MASNSITESSTACAKVSGTVEALAPGVPTSSGLRKGDAVMALLDGGGYAGRQ